MTMFTDEKQRFRSFAERYIVERCASFERGKEKEQAWAAILDATVIYEQIERASRKVEDKMDAKADVNVAAQPGIVQPPLGVPQGMPRTSEEIQARLEYEQAKRRAYQNNLFRAKRSQP